MERGRGVGGGASSGGWRRRAGSFDGTGAEHNGASIVSEAGDAPLGGAFEALVGNLVLRARQAQLLAEPRLVGQGMGGGGVYFGGSGGMVEQALLVGGGLQ